MLARCDRMAIEAKQVLFKSHGAIPHVYFPLSELRSVLERFSQALMNQISQSVLGSVTVAAGVLQEAGLIRYTRGNLTVVDRRRLEASSCECYEVVRREFERLLQA